MRRGLPELTDLPVDAPAPATGDLIATRGQNSVTEALRAWEMRLNGAPITDVAHQMGLSIEAARVLIREAHAAISEDLKEALEQNRTLDLARIDGLLQTFYPAAKAGDDKAATVTLKCLERRAKLTGAEPGSSVPSGASPQNVLIWIQSQMPAINRIVDALPAEEAPGAPG